MFLFYSILKMQPALFSGILKPWNQTRLDLGRPLITSFFIDYDNMNDNLKNKNTYRENLNNKLNDRFMIKQINNNPFLDTSYIDDIKVQEKFLIPKSSNNDL